MKNKKRNNKKILKIIGTTCAVLLIGTVFSFADEIKYDSRIILDCFKNKAIVENDTNLYRYENNKMTSIDDIEYGNLITIRGKRQEINDEWYINIETSNIKNVYIKEENLILDYSKQNIAINNGYLWCIAEEGELLYKDKYLEEPVYKCEINENFEFVNNYNIDDIMTETNNILYIQKGEMASVTELIDNVAKVVLSSGDTGYISVENVELSVADDIAFKIDYSKGNSIRSSLVKTALTYEGGTYVWGGTTLGKGVDCSGFVMEIFKKFGINTSRNSKSQYLEAKEINKKDLKPGDVVFYNRDGDVGHVAIYIGNDMIIHAKGAKYGIVIDNMNYATPVGYGTYLSK